MSFARELHKMSFSSLPKMHCWFCCWSVGTRDLTGQDRWPRTQELHRDWGIYLCLVKYLQAHEGSNRYTSIAHPLCSLSLPLLTYPRSSKILSFFNSFQNLSHINDSTARAILTHRHIPRGLKRCIKQKLKPFGQARVVPVCSVFPGLLWACHQISMCTDCPWRFASFSLFTI